MPQYPIYWKHNLVGYIADPTRWPVVWRGRWIPEETAATTAFLDALKRGRYLWVVVQDETYGERFATIEALPAQEIELRLSIDDSETIRLDFDKTDFTPPSAP